MKRLCSIPLFILSITAGITGIQASHSTTKNNIPPLESFFEEPERFAECLSPDGKQIAYLGTADEKSGTKRTGRHLWIIHINQLDTPLRISSEGESDVAAFFWIGQHRLLWQSNETQGRTRLFLANLQNGKTRELIPNEKRNMVLQGVVNSKFPCILVGLSDKPSAFPDLYRVKLDDRDSGRIAELVCKNDFKIISWAWDITGAPRAGLRWCKDGAKELLDLRDGTDTVILRAPPEDDARLLFSSHDGLFIHLITNLDTDLTHLLRINLETGKRNTIASDPMKQVDLDQIIIDSKDNTILAVGYSDGKNRWQALMPKFDQWLKLLYESFPGNISLNILGFDASQTHVLLEMSSDRDPGTLYLFNLKNHQLRKLWNRYPKMGRSTLSQTKPYNYTASDGHIIPAYLTTPHGMKKPWPLVVFPHGGPRMRTRPGFDGRVQFFTSRGYAVFQPNFRGSRGYGKAFMNAGDRQWGTGVMQTDITDGVNHLIKQGLVDPKRIAIFGGSYGGYAALAGLTFTPALYAAGISLFGISDLTAYATHSPIEWKAYAGDTMRRLGNPDIEAEREDLRKRSPINHAASIKAPLLIYHGLNDQLIPVKHTQGMVKAMLHHGRNVDYLLATDEGHGFSQAASEMAVYRAIELFLHKNLGGKVGPEPTEEVSRRLQEFRKAAKK